MNRSVGMTALSLLCLAASRPASGMSPRVVEAVRTDSPPEIDGKLEDLVWQKAQPTSEFIEVDPVEDAPAVGESIVRVLYDANNLYLGLRCLEPEPNKIRALQTERDSFLWDDDSIEVFIDTYLDRRSAFCFVTNPLGTQMDQKISREGEVIDRQWDCEWEVEVSRDEGGWAAEMVIPFPELSFDPKRGNVWGINFWRNAPGRHETTTWADVSENIFRVSRYGELRGLDLSKVQKPRRIELIPYVTSAVDFNDNVEADVETGLDISYRPTRSIFVDATVNPDISQIEADPTIIALARVEPRMPEKRPFFEQGVDLLRTPLSLFYSRRIGYRRTEDDRFIYEGMDYGLKVSGRSDRYHFLGLTARTKESEEDYYVAAYQQNISQRSSVSFLAIDKEEQDDANRAFSLLGYFPLPKEYEITAQYARVEGENIDGDDGIFLGLERTKDPFTVFANYSQIGPEFSTVHREFGFLPETEEEKFDGWRGFMGRASYKFELGDRFIRNTGIGTHDSIYWNYNDEKVRQNNQLFSWVSMGDSHFNVFGGRQTNLEESGTTESNYFGFEADYNPKWGGLGLFTYPFGTPREPDARYVSVHAGWKPTRRLYVSLHHNRRWYENDKEEEVEQDENEDEWNSRFRVTYSFSRDISFRTEVELNSAEAGFANFLFRWKYRRNSFLYLGLNLLEDEEEENARMLFVKATFCF